MRNSKKVLSVFLAAMLTTPMMANAASPAFPATFYGKNAYTPLSINGYKMVWDDEFDTFSAGLEKKYGGSGNTKWVGPVHAPLGIGRMAPPSDPATFSLVPGGPNNGTLYIKTREERTGVNLQKTGWVDANLQTMDSLGNGFSFVNGYAEVYAKLPTAHGSHAGIWLLSMHDVQKGHSEIDVIESYGRSDSVGDHMSIHLWPGKSSLYPVHVGSSSYSKVANLQTQYHKFGILLQPDTITWYVDGKSVMAIPRIAAMKDQPFYLLLSNFTDPNRKDGYEPSTMEVSYVHVYAPPSLSVVDAKDAKNGVLTNTTGSEAFIVDNSVNTGTLALSSPLGLNDALLTRMAMNTERGVIHGKKLSFIRGGSLDIGAAGLTYRQLVKYNNTQYNLWTLPNATFDPATLK